MSRRISEGEMHLQEYKTMNVHSYSEKCFVSPIRIPNSTAKVYRYFQYLLKSGLQCVKFITFRRYLPEN